jgi:hypothetical protein
MKERDWMIDRRLASLFAAVALVTAACGSTTTAPATTAPTASLTAAPTAAPTSTPTPTPATPAPTATPTATPSTGQMTHARSTHTATALADGRVLLAGGYDADLTTASADLYNPATGTFAATGPMTAARGFFTATLLSDGRVLVAGGTPSSWDQSGPELASTELCDPRTGTFSATGSMATPRDAHAATLLLDGRVLITGGDDRFRHPVASAELYDPKTGTFSPTGSMKAARSFHVATLLADGRVLVTGGSPVGMNSTVGRNLASAEVYDPRTGKFSPTGSMTTQRASHTATRLTDGRVLVTGGAASTASAAGSHSQASAELYDPKTGRFTATGSMSFARTFEEATLLADGRVLVTGGSADGWTYADNYYAEAEIYDPKAGTFAATGPMADTLVSQTATLLPGGRVLIAGGYDGIADVTTAELYDPKTGTFSLTSPGG